MGSACPQSAQVQRDDEADLDLEARQAAADRLRQQHTELREQYRVLERDVAEKAEQNRELKEIMDCINMNAPGGSPAEQDESASLEEAREAELQLLREQLVQLEGELEPLEELRSRVLDLEEKRQEALNQSVNMELDELRADCESLLSERDELRKAMAERQQLLDRAEDLLRSVQDEWEAASPAALFKEEEAGDATRMELAELRAENAKLQLQCLDLEDLADDMYVRALQTQRKFERAEREREAMLQELREDSEGALKEGLSPTIPGQVDFDESNLPKALAAYDEASSPYSEAPAKAALGPDSTQYIPWAEPWSVADSFFLCEKGDEASYASRIPFVDQAAITSVPAAVEALNRGEIQGVQALCAAYAAEQQSWFLLHRPGAAAAALAYLGLSENTTPAVHKEVTTIAAGPQPPVTIATLPSAAAAAAAARGIVIGSPEHSAVVLAAAVEPQDIRLQASSPTPLLPVVTEPVTAAAAANIMRHSPHNGRQWMAQ